MFTCMYLCGSSSHLCLASLRRWPHGDLLIMRSGGKNSRHEIKVHSSRSHINVASAGRCPSFVWGQFVLFPLLISLGLVQCYTSSGTCLESATLCHALAVPSALTPPDTAKPAEGFPALTLIQNVFSRVRSRCQVVTHLYLLSSCLTC